MISAVQKQVKIQFWTFLKKKIKFLGFHVEVPTREDLSIDVSITNVEMTVMKLRWFQLYRLQHKSKFNFKLFWKKIQLFGFPMHCRFAPNQRETTLCCLYVAACSSYLCCVTMSTHVCIHNFIHGGVNCLNSVPYRCYSYIAMYRSSPLIPLDRCLTAACSSAVSQACGLALPTSWVCSLRGLLLRLLGIIPNFFQTLIAIQVYLSVQLMRLPSPGPATD